MIIMIRTPRYLFARVDLCSLLHFGWPRDHSELFFRIRIIIKKTDHGGISGDHAHSVAV